ncbi:MAG: transcriptional regulator, LysR family [Phenylobacterium sp.]|nr:transcriptional regulator, LysR family [Phenylobacterium sp.]
MQPADLARLTTFVAVAERGSFAKAANVLGRTTSTVSHTIKTLEEGLRVRLFNRTTRSVALTEAGEQLLSRVQPLLGELGEALGSMDAFRDAPHGRLRLSVSSLALAVVVASVLRSFTSAYPGVTLDVVVDDEGGDLVEGREDAGVRSFDRIPRDMIVARIGPPSRLVAVASPDYLRRHPAPRTPADLAQHKCVQFRFASGAVYRWEFIEGERIVEAPTGVAVVTDNIDFLLRAALDGVAMSYTLEGHAASHIAAGRLQVVLEPYSLPYDGWFLYYPSRRNMPGPLRAFLEFLRRPEVGRAIARGAAPAVSGSVYA